MARIVKEADERKNEILDAAERLFTVKGYGKTTILDILEQVGIAKGTFYYYFKSKEEVMDAIIERFIEQDVQKARQIALDKGLTPVQKFCGIIAAQQPRTDGPKDRMIEEFHLPANAQMHEKSIVRSILAISPILGQVVSQGVEQHIFSTEYPLEAIQILLASGQVLFDSSMFAWTPAEMEQKVNGFIAAMEAVLGAEAGTFEPMKQILAAGNTIAPESRQKPESCQKPQPCQKPKSHQKPQPRSGREE